MFSNNYNNEVERLKQVDDRNEFIRRYYGLYITLKWFIYPISIALCVALTSAHLYVNNVNWLVNPILAGGLTILFAVFLELLKSKTSDSFFDGARAGDYAKESRAGIFWLAAIGFIATFAYGVYFDFSGAPVVTEFAKDNMQPVEAKLINIDSINAYYDNRIASEEKAITKGSGMTWKGKIVSDGRELINLAQGNKMKIEDQRAQAILLATEENKLTKLEYDESVANSSYWLQGLLTIVLLGQLIYFWFNAIYNDVGKKELGIIVSGERKSSVRSVESVSPILSNDTIKTSVAQTETENPYSPKMILGFAEVSKMRKTQDRKSQHSVETEQPAQNAVTVLAESRQRFKAETEKTENQPISDRKTRQKNKTESPDEIVKFIKRFRQRYKQSVVADKLETRQKNERLVKKDWVYLEKLGYTISVNSEDKTKLEITS